MSLPATAFANGLAPIWTGIYAGINGGMSWADLDTNGFGNLDTSRASFGVHGGYNWHFGNMLIGVEADASHRETSIGFHTGGGGSATFDSDWSGSLRGRVGFLAGPALLYATAGWAWSDLSFTERTGAGGNAKGSGTLDGVVYGIGAETFLMPSVSVRFEVLRYDYGTEKLTFDGAASAVRNLDHGDTVVRAGVTFHLR